MQRNLGELRIIGGEWRSRKFAFAADPAHGLRATPDRVRQTVFDWLAPVIHGATVLDLFAGSGAMGLEALSRGAAAASFVDNNASQIRAIGAAAQKLGAGDRAKLVQADAIGLCKAASATLGRFDVIFMDPPFGSDLLQEALPLVVAHCAKPHTRIYCEWGDGAPVVPEGWQWHRQKQAGAVSYGLINQVQP